MTRGAWWRRGAARSAPAPAPRAFPPLAAVYVPVAAAGALVVAAALAAGFATLELDGRAFPTPEPTAPRAVPEVPEGAEPPPSGQPFGQPDASGGSWLPPLLLTLLSVALVAAILWLMWLLLGRLHRAGLRPAWLRLRTLRAPTAVASADRPAGPEEDQQELVAAVDEAMARSADADDPRRVVIDCWVRLTEAAQAAGVPRYQSDTATELVVRLLRGHRVSEPVLAAFGSAYLRARYATHPVDERARTEARSALRWLRAELAPGPEVPA